MGRLLSLVRGVESSLRSRLGQWMQEVSLAGDLAEVEIDAAQANIVQLQVDVTAPGWLAAYLTQTAWYVNSVTGNDANDALTGGAAIKTLAELTRRWSARTFSPAITAVNVYLAGTFPTEKLILVANFVAPAPGGAPPTITVSGTMTTVDSGALSGYTAWSSATSVRGTLTDAAQDFTPHVRRRIRATSGVALGAVTWIGSLGGGITVANVGRFRTNTSYTGSLKDMAINDTYVIETFDTQIAGFYIDCRNGWFMLKDVEIAATAGNIYVVCTSRMSRQYIKIWGCRFLNASSGQIQLEGDMQPIGCAFDITAGGFGMQYAEGFMNGKSWCLFGALYFYNCMAQLDSTMCDGNGASFVGVFLYQNANVYITNTFWAVFGCVNGVATTMIIVGATNTSFSSSSGYVWGSGNTTTTAVQVVNGSNFQYAAAVKPTLTGVVPGNDVILAGAAPIAWAGVPAASALPDTAVIQVRK